MRRGRVQHGAIHCFPQAFAAPGDYLFFLLLQIVVELPLLKSSLRIHRSLGRSSDGSKSQKMMVSSKPSFFLSVNSLIQLNM